MQLDINNFSEYSVGIREIIRLFYTKIITMFYSYTCDRINK